MNATSKRPPAPFSKLIDPSLPELRVYAGTRAWAAAPYCRTSSRRLLCPPDEDPAGYAWPVRRKTVLVIVRGKWTEAAERALARALLRDGARGVMVIDDSGPPLDRMPDDVLFHMEHPGRRASRVYTQ